MVIKVTLTLALVELESIIEPGCSQLNIFTLGDLSDVHLCHKTYRLIIFSSIVYSGKGRTSLFYMLTLFS